MLFCREHGTVDCCPLCIQEETEGSKLAELEALVRRVFEADAAYGCGFYNDDAWREAYLNLQKHIKFKGFTCVFDPAFDDLGDEK